MCILITSNFWFHRSWCQPQFSDWCPDLKVLVVNDKLLLIDKVYKNVNVKSSVPELRGPIQTTRMQSEDANVTESKTKKPLFIQKRSMFIYQITITDSRHRYQGHCDGEAFRVQLKKYNFICT